MIRNNEKLRAELKDALKCVDGQKGDKTAVFNAIARFSDYPTNWVKMEYKNEIKTLEDVLNMQEDDLDIAHYIGPKRKVIFRELKKEISKRLQK